MIKDLVTILTPAYNSETLIPRLLNSVLEQTYAHISMIVVNDGSTDRTEEVIRSYIPKFEERRYSLKIINQENSGQSAAINNGLKYVDGEFLVWPDSDDWYATSDAIEKLTNALKRYGDDVGIAHCAYNYVNEETMEVERVDYPNQGSEPHYMFDSAVYNGPGFWFAPGGWMIKTKFLDELIPQREIYQSRLTGQNVQMLWPYLYAKKCISVEEPLFTYLIRQNSHSRGLFKDIETKLRQQDGYYETYKNVLLSLDLSKEKMDKILLNKEEEIILAKISICENAHDYAKMRFYSREYNRKCKQGIFCASLRRRIKYKLYSLPFLGMIVSKLKKHI